MHRKFRFENFDKAFGFMFVTLDDVADTGLDGDLGGNG